MATSLDTKLARQIGAALIRFADRKEAGLDGDRALHTACVLAEKFTDDGDFLALREALQFDNGWDDTGWPDPDAGEPYIPGGFAHWEVRP